MHKHIYHRHRIIPGHMGGTYAPENVVLLTIEEHAEAHRLLYEEHGRWEDKVAWLGLSGQIGKDEMIRELQKEAQKKRAVTMNSEDYKSKMSAAKKGKKMPPRTAEWRAKISAAKKGQKHTEESKAKMRASHTGKKRGPHSEESKAKMRAAKKGKKMGPMSEKQKANISAAKKGKSRTDSPRRCKKTGRFLPKKS